MVSLINRQKNTSQTRLILIFAFIALILACSETIRQQSKQPDGTSLIDKALAQLYVNTDSSIYYATRVLNQPGSDSSLWLTANYIYAANLCLLGKNNQAFDLFNQIIVSHHLKNYDTLHILSKLHLGEIIYNSGEYENSLSYFQSALEQSKNIRFINGQISGLQNIGKFNHSVGSYNQSYLDYKEAMNLALTHNRKPFIVSLHCKIGKHHETLGNYSNALDNYLNAERYLPEISDQMICATTYNHLGNIYDIINNEEKAYHYHQLALIKRTRLKYREGIAKSVKNIGEVLENQMKLDSAEICFRASLQICAEINYKKGMVKACQNLGDVYLKKEQFNSALLNYNKALKLAESINYDKGYLKALIQLANLNINQKNHVLAIDMLQKGEKKAIEKNLLADLKDIKYLQYQIFSTTNRYKEALICYKNYSDVKEKLLNNQKNRIIAELQIEYDTEKKEQQNIMLVKENQLKTLQISQKNKLILLSSIVVFFLIAFLIFILVQFGAKRKLNSRLEKYNLEIIRKNKKLERLNHELDTANHDKDKIFSIITHELRNPLWWFRNLADILSKRFFSMNKESQLKALKSFDESAKTAFHLVENLLLWSRSQLNRLTVNPVYIDVNQLINENFLLHKSIIEHKKIKLERILTDNVMAFADKELINTVIRNLLSNAVKFTAEKGSIIISTIIYQQSVEIRFEDNGIGISPDNIKRIMSTSDYFSTLGLMQEKGSGLGLILCKEFVSLNKGKINIISETDQGTTVVINLPAAEEGRNEKDSFSAQHAYHAFAK